MNIEKHTHCYFRKLALLVGLVMTVHSFNSHAAPGTPATSPLFIGNIVKPNIILPIDTSGSMDFETSVAGATHGGFWWHTTNKTFLNPPPPDEGNSPYLYIFPNGYGSGGRMYPDSNYGAAVPPTINYAFARSNYYNKAYYDPTRTYNKWLDDGINTFLDADLTATRYDPILNNTFTVNLFSVLAETTSGWTFKMQSGMFIPTSTEYVYLPDTTFLIAGGDIDVGGTENVAIKYWSATYYTPIDDVSVTYVVDGNNGNCSAASRTAAHYSLFETKPSTLVITDGVAGGVYALGLDGACLIETKIAVGDPEAQNFANWFMYYRRRHQAMRASVPYAFDGMSNLYVKAFSIQKRSADLTMLDFGTQSNTFYNDIYNLYPKSADGLGTPNREAVFYAGQQFQRTNTDAPVTNECQKNFTLLFTDGHASPDTGSGVGDADDTVAPFSDSYSNTMADIAAYFYDGSGTPLRTTGFTAGRVPVSNSCDSTTDAPLWVDCQEDLHVNLYAVLLNTTGNIYNGTTYNTIYDAHPDAMNPTWLDPTTQDATQIDDLYHACINSRGELYNASSPADIKASLESALVSITSGIGSASAIAVNTTDLSDETAVYQARFDSEYWSGQLLSKSIDPDNGVVNPVETWDAGTVLPTAVNRNIISFNPATTHTDGTGLGVAFSSVASLSTTAIADLGTALPGGTVCGGVACTSTHMLDYLRGDRTHESITAFRVRDPDTVLGDIVHSAPVSVNDQNLKWPDGDGSNGFPSGTDNSTGAYSSFVAAQSSRPNMIYFGANDGMLHGVQGSDGVEKLAYIPNSLFSASANTGLHYLSEQTYPHQYYVDNEPTASDVYIKNRLSTGAIDTTMKWRTVLLGSLRSGGRGLFALDITTPAEFIAANAAKLVLWEFDNNAGTGDVDLGLTYSKPAIGPTNAVDASGNVRWAAIVGNGYNSGVDGGTGDCEAHLFIIFLDGGFDGVWTNDLLDIDYDTTDYIKLETKTGDTLGNCNGLSSPRTVDLNDDGKIDRVYAGDVLGNMWVFDLCNDSDTSDTTYTCQASDWKVAYGTVADPDPLFTALDDSGNAQSITVKPRIVVNPDIASSDDNLPNYLVLFGTGQYLTSGDTTDTTTTNSFYGIWDNNDTAAPGIAIPYTRDDLQEQIYSSHDILDANGVAGTDGYAETRVTSDIPIDYAASATSNLAGWYIDLLDTGTGGSNEKVFVDPAINGNQVLFNTNIITSSGCDVGGYHFRMGVNINNGGPPSEPTFDANGDGVINALDLIDTDDDGIGDTAASGQGGTGGQGDGIASAPRVLDNYRCYTTSTGEIICEEIEVPGVDNTGRYSWQELRND